MKKKFILEIDFESYFEDDRQPKTDHDWAQFFFNNMFKETPILGENVDGNEDMVELNNFTLYPANDSI